MALTLQLNGLGIHDWRRWLGRLPPFADITDESFQQILDHLLAQRILYSDGIRLSLGDQAHEDFGHRHFMELLSVFTTPPLLAVLHGRKELGQVDQVSVTRSKPNEAVVLSLGGRSWRVLTVDWRARQVLVEPTNAQGKTSWLGVRRGVSYVIARAVHRLLTSDGPGEGWSDRAAEQIGRLRSDYFFLKPQADVIVADSSDGDFEWHTLSGNDVNQVLAQALDSAGIATTGHDDFSINLNHPGDGIRLESAIRALNPETARDHFSPSSQSAQALKFNECLPTGVVVEILRKRLVNLRNLHATLQRPRRFLIASITSHPV